MSDILLVTRAWNFSAQHHATQKRKGEAQEPYVNHLAEVAELVAEATRGQDANLVAAAVLHDTIEDTETSFAELRTTFNADIADLVAEVTDDKTLPKALRRQLQIENAAKKSRRAKILKLADKTSNLLSLAKSPPADWNLEERRDYLTFALDVAKGLRGANPWLETQFDTAAAQAEATLVQAPATHVP
jgi:(p)ppGpp synthase/HD superfamily hydrolase